MSTFIEGEPARPTGFAQSPGVLKIFGFIPGIGSVIFFPAPVWQLVAIGHRSQAGSRLRVDLEGGGRRGHRAIVELAVASILIAIGIAFWPPASEPMADID